MQYNTSFTFSAALLQYSSSHHTRRRSLRSLSSNSQDTLPLPACEARAGTHVRDLFTSTFYGEDGGLHHRATGSNRIPGPNFGWRTHSARSTVNRTSAPGHTYSDLLTSDDRESYRAGIENHIGNQSCMGEATRGAN